MRQFKKFAFCKLFAEVYVFSPGMNIITKGTIKHYVEKYPLAKTALLNWYEEFLKVSFADFNELKSVYGSASIISNHRVIFNIKGNEYRLITSINFRRKALYIIWFGTHKEYDKIDAANIPFEVR